VPTSSALREAFPPPLVMFLFFNRQIVAGMTSGAVKG
jgi:ABC-type glycerol-3-phosphate transport system permease component